jgi:hypothetical protein
MNTGRPVNRSHQLRLFLIGLVLLSTTLACALPAGIGAPAPADDGGRRLRETEQALSAQATQLAAQQATLVAREQEQNVAAQQPTDPPAPTATSMPSIAPTNTPLPLPSATLAPELTATAIPTATQVPPEPTADIEANLKKAKILVFEDTQPIGYWIRSALDSAGYKYTHVGDAVGDFMENLNSGIEWDLIIVGAESKAGVRGEFWDAISQQIDRGAAVVVEIWYLDLTVNGKIKPLLTRCGIDYQKDLPLADSIYWLDPTHPVFNQPNTVMPLLHYSRHWENQAGDLIRLRPGSEAVLLAGTQSKRYDDYGQIAVCLDGTVIFQTFSNHDYPQGDILQLWQNYADFTLRNHFLNETGE